MDDWDFIEDDFTCPECGITDCVPFIGATKSKVVIIGEFPGKKEIEKGKPMVGAMGSVLRKELGYLGLDLRSVRRGNLWQHTPLSKTPPKEGTKKREQYDKCLAHGTDLVIKEAKGKKGILLMGSDTIRVFLVGKNVKDVAGLRVESPFFSAPVIVAMQNPAIVFHGGVGETRLSLQKFVKALEKEKII